MTNVSKLTVAVIAMVGVVILVLYVDSLQDKIDNYHRVEVVAGLDAWTSQFIGNHIAIACREDSLGAVSNTNLCNYWSRVGQEYSRYRDSIGIDR